MLMRDRDIRRLDGSIDIDFHRQRGLTERRVVMTRFFKPLRRFGRPLVAVAVVIAALSMAPSRHGEGWNGPAGMAAKLPNLLALNASR